jgi:Arc/MetJ family transcription regulator
MKRTNLVLDEEVLKNATRLLGAKTYSEAVNLALVEVIKLINLRNLTNLMGQGIWSGNLSEMREDKPLKSALKKKTKRKQSVA